MSDQYPPPQYPPPSGGDPNLPPGPPGPPGGAPYQGAPVPPPQKKRSVGKIVLIILGALLLVCVLCVGAFYVFGSNLVDEFRNNPTTAQVGDCLGGDDIDRDGASGELNVKKVDCADADATYKVVGRVPGKTQAQAESDDTICTPFAQQGAQRTVWLADAGETTGTVFCLAPNK